ncbi:ATP-binding protein [Ancylobacter rudongensis]|uniref:Histidine kinase-, DNA gyrase B-, and HSP90-like ATPase n=1 Tax=Ancylobacter rudongensis TaxID=177413 RepID=A0A1G4UQK6_9HYPH|nr:ATP-binding protein [Ancylobacter rudongensis]SCW95936.1 Histidine kinase-, DNA gyrase B-, and HSP90-like ATPase [Ancylobacter rudongensis]
MEVSVTSEPASHVILGGQVSGAFNIEQSAHGFRILSDTLYRDKIRAVAREYLCNAYDSHIVAAKPEHPVEVTLNDTTLTISDQGVGIPDDQIINVYCTLFGSTKRADERQTGGFGLGSKVGFAYTGHFQVTNHHAGVKTIYVMHVGGAVSEGKPVCQKMVSLPTERTGVDVSIELKSKDDAFRFRQNIRRLAYEGGIPVKLNGELLPVVDYAALEARGYGLVRGESDYGTGVFVRVGQVRYPIDAHLDLDENVRKAQDLTLAGYDLVLMPPVGTVRPTPSRESISYEEDTIRVINDLLARFVRDVDGRKSGARRRAILGAMKERTLLEVTRDTTKSFSKSASPPVVCDPTEIANIRAERAMNNGESPKGIELFHATCATFPGARRYWRFVSTYRHAPNRPQKKNARRVYQRAQFDRAGYIKRRVLRLAAIAGINPKNIFVRESDTSSLSSFLRAEPKRREGEYNSRAERRAAYYNQLRSITIHVADVRAGTGVAGPGFYFIQKDSCQALGQLQALAIKWDVLVRRIAKPVYERKPRVPKAERPPKPEPAAHLFSTVTLKAGDRGGGGEFAFAYSVQQMPVPTTYVRLPHVQRDFARCFLTPSRYFPRQLQRLKPLFGDVAVVRTKADERRIEELKTPRLVDVLLDYLERKSKRPALAARRALALQRYSGDGLNGSTARINMLHHSMQSALATFGIFETVPEADEQLFAAWQMAFSLFDRSRYYRQTSVCDLLGVGKDEEARFATITAAVDKSGVLKLTGTDEHIMPLLTVAGGNLSVSDHTMPALLSFLKHSHRTLTPALKKAA